MPYCCGVQPF